MLRSASSRMPSFLALLVVGLLLVEANGVMDQAFCADLRSSSLRERIVHWRDLASPTPLRCVALRGGEGGERNGGKDGQAVQAVQQEEPADHGETAKELHAEETHRQPHQPSPPPEMEDTLPNPEPRDPAIDPITPPPSFLDPSPGPDTGRSPTPDAPGPEANEPSPPRDPALTPSPPPQQRALALELVEESSFRTALRLGTPPEPVVAARPELRDFVAARPVPQEVLDDPALTPSPPPQQRAPALTPDAPEPEAKEPSPPRNPALNPSPPPQQRAPAVVEASAGAGCRTEPGVDASRTELRPGTPPEPVVAARPELQNYVAERPALEALTPSPPPQQRASSVASTTEASIRPELQGFEEARPALQGFLDDHLQVLQRAVKGDAAAIRAVALPAGFFAAGLLVAFVRGRALSREEDNFEDMLADIVNYRI
ncbi:hypothetical protein T484DRAFT_1968908 [Baffinella frigidus]|nr:hypothetical protein T484DRAFT_1968908 [Cryptophyta sp. CCMP2293]|mmetsp:Transcript_30950/g.70835  ORF Transcript_30950/g.70835 Transcript_30950/m.70835 type:complete len:430 (-) Transcript_30950:143-1432(-)